MTISAWLTQATNKLESAGIGTARLDALVLLSDVTGKDRTHLLAHPELELTSEQENTLESMLKRRIDHEPLAYIREKTEFYGREFYINQDVLEPRPESETMFELLPREEPFRTFIDVGTGSGALAITAALEVPEAKVIAIDIDPKCIKVAVENSQKHETNIEFIEGNLLESITDEKLRGPIGILANLPYVPDDYTLNQAAYNEPHHAIFGGPDGLDLYRTLFKQLRTNFKRPLFVYTESLPFQHEVLLSIAAEHGFKLLLEEDFIQLFTKNFSIT